MKKVSKKIYVVFLCCLMVFIIFILSSCQSDQPSSESKVSSLGELIGAEDIVSYSWRQGDSKNGYVLQFKEGIANFLIVENSKSATVEGFYSFYDKAFRIVDNKTQTTYEFQYTLNNDKLSIQAGNIKVDLTKVQV